MKEQKFKNLIYISWQLRQQKKVVCTNNMVWIVGSDIIIFLIKIMAFLINYYFLIETQQNPVAPEQFPFQ